jgi:hypothetical protein
MAPRIEENNMFRFLDQPAYRRWGYGWRRGKGGGFLATKINVSDVNLEYLKT